MTNEELAAQIQNGDQEAVNALWDQIKNFVVWSARKVIRPLEERGVAHGIELDDLVSVGYLTMVDALGDYDSNRGLFLTWFSWRLKAAFYKEIGCSYRAEKVTDPETGESIIKYRRVCVDPSMVAKSLSSPAYRDPDSEDVELEDVLEDPAAAEAFEEVEDGEFLLELKKAIREALDSLPAHMSRVLRRRYYDCVTLQELAEELHQNKSGVSSLEKRALKRIRDSSAGAKLRSFFYFDYYRGTGPSAYFKSGISVQERYIILKENNEERSSAPLFSSDPFHKKRPGADEAQQAQEAQEEQE